MYVKLNVPYAEKDAAKAAGARWSARNKTWCAYTRYGLDLDRFAPWLDVERAKAQVDAWTELIRNACATVGEWANCYIRIRFECYAPEGYPVYEGSIGRRGCALVEALRNDAGLNEVLDAERAYLREVGLHPGENAEDWQYWLDRIRKLAETARSCNLILAFA